MSDHSQLLKRLGLKDVNPGACFGPGKFAEIREDNLFDSINPTTGEVIARISGATVDDYEKVMATARETAVAWRLVPAPERGNAVRLANDALRDYQDALGSLVALEMGKIKPEGDGEGQGRIGLGDCALGQSRMLYGRSEERR